MENLSVLYDISARIPEPIANLLLLLTIVGLGRLDRGQRQMREQIAQLTGAVSALVNRRRADDPHRAPAPAE